MMKRIALSATTACALGLVLAQAHANDAERQRGTPEASVPIYEPQDGNAVADGGFEAGTPNPFWDEFSSNFGTPLCTIASCGQGGGTGPFGGAWWTWFGGISGVSETGSVTQSVVIPVGEDTLSFYLEIPVADSTGFLDVTVDGSSIFSVTEANQPQYSVYQEVAVDISAFADGGAHTLEFFSTTDPGAGPLNFFVDRVSIGECRITLALSKNTVRPGESIDYEVHLHHKRLATVSTPFLLWVTDSNGDRIVQQQTAPINMDYGDMIHRRGTLAMPGALKPGVYFFSIGIDQMQQGRALVERSFRVVN